MRRCSSRSCAGRVDEIVPIEGHIAGSSVGPRTHPPQAGTDARHHRRVVRAGERSGHPTCIEVLLAGHPQGSLHRTPGAQEHQGHGRGRSVPNATQPRAPLTPTSPASSPFTRPRSVAREWPLAGNAPAGGAGRSGGASAHAPGMPGNGDLKRDPRLLSCRCHRDVAGRSVATGGHVSMSAIAVAPPVARGAPVSVWRP